MPQVPLGSGSWNRLWWPRSAIGPIGPNGKGFGLRWIWFWIRTSKLIIVKVRIKVTYDIIHSKCSLNTFNYFTYFKIQFKFFLNIINLLDLKTFKITNKGQDIFWKYEPLRSNKFVLPFDREFPIWLSSFDIRCPLNI